MYQEIVGLYGDCCALDSSMSKRLLFWSNELIASTSHLRLNSEKISAVSEFVFKKLFLSTNRQHCIVEWGQAMQERKCHPLKMAILYGYFCEAIDLNCWILNGYSYRFVKFASEGIFDLQNSGSPVPSSQILEFLKSKCSQKSFEPLPTTELKKVFYEEILRGHFQKANWAQVLTTLKLRERDQLGHPRDFTTFAYVYEKLGNRGEALNYLKRFFSFAPQSPLPPDLIEKYHELHFDQIESILSKTEFLPFES